MGKMSSCAVSRGLREREALSFLLFKMNPKHGVIFENVSESMLQPGDILLFPIETSCSVNSSCFQHAAVYCGDGEVIHFQKTTSGGSPDVISKEGFRAMKKRRGKFSIYRKKGGINIQDFHEKVKKVMNSEVNYDLRTNNCIHFALFLLGLADFYMQLVEIQSEKGSCGDGAATCSPPTLALQRSDNVV